VLKPDHAWIEQHIPHQGNMCLLDRVEAWNDDVISCRAVSHHQNANPLRTHGQLAAVCGIEYAAQAMAVHGALLAPQESTTVKFGYLVSVRGAQLYVPRLDDIGAELEIEASCITRSENNLLYQFSIRAAGKLLLEGRATVIVDAEAFA
jgi:predicted hotdog family 3-hydroxylacyl-ACP dehydratase